MPASADYLKKYLSAAGSNGASNDFAESSRPKKRRKKDKHANGISIADDDADLSLNKQEDPEDDTPLIYNTKVRSAEFRKKKQSNWQTAEEDVPEQDEADAILAEAADESADRRAGIDAEDQPTIVDDGPKMSSGAKAGLQTVADTEMLMAREEAQEKKQKKVKTKEVEQETIYRDATGRRIDVSLRRQELRAQEAAKVVAEKKEKESAMGEVQLQQKVKAKQDLEEAKFLTLGRSAEDEDLNAAQKEELRWEDPMAAYMAEREAEREAEELIRNPRKKKQEVVKVRKKEFTGAAPPNRYGIKPGWRWDGVDRGNGFEKEWFLARGKKTRNENLSYQWQMDE